MSNHDSDQQNGPGTTGHEWDGIQELNNPLPRWWVWIFYATIVWGVGYTIAYPAWPLIERATPGLLGYSTRENVQEEIDAAVEMVRREGRGLHGLVNNAGGPPPGDFRDWSQGDWFEAVNANMYSAIDMIRRCLDGMIERRFGRIVNITSVAVKMIAVRFVANSSRAPHA